MAEPDRKPLNRRNVEIVMPADSKTAKPTKKQTTRPGKKQTAGSSAKKPVKQAAKQNESAECSGNNRGKRLWKRYALKCGAVVMIYRPSLFKLGKPVMVKLGPIKDISMRGLAVQYVDHKNLLRDVEELSIALPDGRVVVEKLRFRPVVDFEVVELPKTGKIRNLCVNFTNILPMQKIQLERFINEYACEINTG
jgi:hypothetical protein